MDTNTTRRNLLRVGTTAAVCTVGAAMVTGGVGPATPAKGAEPPRAEWDQLCARFRAAQAEQVRIFAIDLDSTEADVAEEACTAALLAVKAYPVTSLAMIAEKADVLVEGFGELEGHDALVLVDDMRRVALQGGR